MNNPLDPLYEGIQRGINTGLEAWQNREPVPGFLPPWAGAPPMVPQFGEALMGSRLMEPFFEGMRDEMRRQLEQMGMLNDQARGNWKDVLETQREMLEQTKEVTEEIAALKDAPQERLRVQQALNEMNLPEVIQERALSFLEAMGAFGTEIQRQAVAVDVARERQQDEQAEEEATSRVKEMLGGVLRTLGVTEQVVAQSQMGDTAALALGPGGNKAVPMDVTEQREEARREAAAQHPFGDVIDTGAVGPGDRPDPGGYPEGSPPGGGGGPGGPGGGGGRGPHEWAARMAGIPKSPVEEESPWGLPDTWGEGVRFGAQVGNWQQAAMGAVRHRLNSFATEWGDINRPDGFTDFAGQWHWANPEEGAAYERRMNQVGRAQGAIDAFAGGDGLSGAVNVAAPMLGRALGVAGAVYGGTQLITNTLEQQRQANMPYTSTYGRGQADAYGQRLQEWAFSNIGMMGTMNAQQAGQLYQGVAELGFEGGERERALNFAVDNYRQWGMDTAQSMEFITMATAEGIESLDEYRQGLIAVAESAKESGQSIKEAQESYMNAVRSLQGFTSGSATAEVASVVTGIQQFREHTPMGKIDYTRALQSDSVLEQIASRTGTDYDTLSTGITGGDQAIVRGAIGDLEQALFDYATQNRQPSARTRERIAEIRRLKGDNPSVDEVNEVANLLQEDGVFEPRSLGDISQQVYGFRLDLTQAKYIIASKMMQNAITDVETIGRDVTENWNEASPDASGLVQGKRSGLDGLFDRHRLWDARDDMLQDWGLNTQDDERNGWTTRWNTHALDDADPIYKATRQYFQDIATGERSERSTNLEEVFRHIGSKVEESPEDARAWAEKTFVATDSEGREVSFGMQDLAKYIPEIEAGRVSELRQDGSRVALQDIVGFTPRGQQDEDKGSLVKVEVEAKGTLADVLTFKQTGPTDVQRARSRGHAPTPFAEWFDNVWGGG